MDSGYPLLAIRNEEPTSNLIILKNGIVSMRKDNPAPRCRKENTSLHCSMLLLQVLLISLWTGRQSGVNLEKKQKKFNKEFNYNNYSGIL